MVGFMAGGRSLEAMLKESAARFLRELHTTACDFAGFRSIFFRILQSSPDPPLDAVWLYAAAAFLESRVSELADKVAAARDLFHLLSACSAARPGTECIALLAPVVCEVNGLVGEVKGGNFPSKKGRKLTREVEGLVEGILGYIGMCSASRDEKCNGEVFCLADLVRVWTGGEGEEEGFGMFFPLVDDRVRSLVREEVRVEYLAAVVMLEAFLLKLKLKLGGGGETTELHKEIKIWAIGTVTVFRDRSFFDTLLRVLSESSLSRIIPLSCDDEALLREALFDALLLVDYSFLNLRISCEISDASMRGLAMTRLMVFLEAARHSRSKGDHSKALLYSTAFSRSSLPTDIIKWVLNQTEVPKSRLPVSNSPEGLLKWLYNLEDKRLISLDLSELRAKFSLNDLKLYGKQESLNLESVEDGSDFVVIDKEGEENFDREASDGIEESQTMDSVFLDAAQTMGLGLDKRKKKRKGKKEKKRIKFVKYEIDDSMIDNFFPISRDVASGGNEDVNSDSDVSMEEIME